MTRRARLLDVERAPRVKRSRCRDLVPLPRDACLLCGGGLEWETRTTDALFWHGGYGASIQATFALCVNGRCRWKRLVSIDEVRPSTPRRPR